MASAGGEDRWGAKAFFIIYYSEPFPRAAEVQQRCGSEHTYTLTHTHIHKHGVGAHPWARRSDEFDSGSASGSDELQQQQMKRITT